jgi:hypothetical protein
VNVISAPFVVLDGSVDVVAKCTINGEPLDLLAGMLDVAIASAEVPTNVSSVRADLNESRVVRLNRYGNSVGIDHCREVSFEYDNTPRKSRNGQFTLCHGRQFMLNCTEQKGFLGMPPRHDW